MSSTVRGAKHGLGAQPGIRSAQNPAMAPSRGDVRSSPMAYPAERPLPKLPLPGRPETRTPTTDYFAPRIGLTKRIFHHRPPTTPPSAVGPVLNDSTVIPPTALFSPTYPRKSVDAQMHGARLAVNVAG